MFLFIFVTFCISLGMTSFCGDSAIPYSLEVLPDGQPVLGCARPSCFGWAPNNIPASRTATFYRINHQPDGFVREDKIHSPHAADSRYHQPQTAICEPTFQSESCRIENQWAAGIAPLMNTSAFPTVLQCCTYEPLKDSSDRGVATVYGGQIVVGGEVTKHGREYAFDYIANIAKKVNNQGQSVYDVTLRRFPCSPDAEMKRRAHLRKYSKHGARAYQDGTYSESVLPPPTTPATLIEGPFNENGVLDSTVDQSAMTELKQVMEPLHYASHAVSDNQNEDQPTLGEAEHVNTVAAQPQQTVDYHNRHKYYQQSSKQQPEQSQLPSAYLEPAANVITGPVYQQQGAYAAPDNTYQQPRVNQQQRTIYDSYAANGQNLNNNVNNQAQQQQRLPFPGAQQFQQAQTFFNQQPFYNPVQPVQQPAYYPAQAAPSYFGAAGAGGFGNGYYCFTGDTKVRLFDGSEKRMDKIEIDDWLQTVNKTDVMYTPVTFWLHKVPKQKAEFKRLELDDGSVLKLTGKHYIYKTRCSADQHVKVKEINRNAVLAEKVQEGDCLYRISEDNSIIQSNVTKVSTVEEVGIYSPMTSNGKIVVNGVLASCHNVVQSNTLQQTFFTHVENVKSWYASIFGSNKHETELPFGMSLLAKLMEHLVPKNLVTM